MEILEVGPEEYAELVAAPYHVFASAAFNSLNADKCDEVFYLLFRDGKYRLGLIGGRRNNTFLSPFSAPFNGFSFISPRIRMLYLEGAIRALRQWAGEKGINRISLTLPPSIYEPSFISKQLNCLWRENFNIAQIDLNYAFDLESFDEGYMDNIWHNARKNLRISINSGLEFKVCASDREKKLAYDIIGKNRESRGFPLRMTWQQVSDTIRIIPADFFVVEDASGTSIASAIVFHLTQDIVQVVYWGDLNEYGKLKTMNFLSFTLFEHYRKLGFKYVDIGPSTEDSVPNFGLAEFKESIGCTIDTKYTLTCTLD